METPIKLFYWAAFLTLLAKNVACQEYQPSVDMRVPFIPGWITIDGKPTAYYELYLTNFTSDTIALNKVDLIALPDSSLVASFNKTDLEGRFARIGIPGKDKENMLAPGNTCVIYLDIRSQKGNTPMQLGHRIDLEIWKNSDQKLLKDKQKLPTSDQKFLTAGKKQLTVEGAFIQLSQDPPVLVGPPLTDGPWTAVYDPSWQRGHRRVIYTVDGKARIPGRYAIDFIKMDSLGRYAHGDEDLVKNWLGYGADVIAVADGTILVGRDDFRESATLSGRPACPPEKATGNYIELSLGNDHIAFYEHLRPGSIRVKPGQFVKKGEVIASVGFTGQTEGPHLHFHVANRNSPLGAEGIPFAFERFHLLGVYTDFEKFGKAPWTKTNEIRTKGTQTKEIRSSPVIAERPAPGSVIIF